MTFMIYLTAFVIVCGGMGMAVSVADFLLWLWRRK
jgi:hypothetical protein